MHWCQIVQQVPVERSGRAPLGPWYTVSAKLTHVLAHSSVWTVATLASWLSGWSLLLSFVCFYYNKQISFLPHIIAECSEKKFMG